MFRPNSVRGDVPLQAQPFSKHGDAAVVCLLALETRYELYRCRVTDGYHLTLTTCWPVPIRPGYP
jgi:hypothetical protein